MEITMPLFAFIYRPTRLLDESELLARGEAVRSWIIPLLEKGTVRVVTVFGEEVTVVPPINSIDQAIASSDVAGVTLVEAENLIAAQALGHDFPGRHFGTAVEVRSIDRFIPPSN
jgi:hypothetical protein